jgi:hypothetical protein
MQQETIATYRLPRPDDELELVLVHRPGDRVTPWVVWTRTQNGRTYGGIYCRSESEGRAAFVSRVLDRDQAAVAAAIGHPRTMAVAGPDGDPFA